MCCIIFHRLAKCFTGSLFCHFAKNLFHLFREKEGCETNKMLCETVANFVCFSVPRNRNQLFSQKPLSGCIRSTAASLFSYCFVKCSVFRRVFTEFRRHGIPYVFCTSVYSVFYPELHKIPRNHTEFRVTELYKIPRNSVILVCGNLHKSNFKGYFFNSLSH